MVTKFGGTCCVCLQGREINRIWLWGEECWITCLRSYIIVRRSIKGQITSHRCRVRNYNFKCLFGYTRHWLLGQYASIQATRPTTSSDNDSLFLKGPPQHVLTIYPILADGGRPCLRNVVGCLARDDWQRPK